MALLDLLVVPNVCGDDLSNCSNFGLRRLRVTIEEGRPEDAAAARTARDRAVLLGLPSPGEISGAQPLIRDPEYVAAFPHLPLHAADVRVELGEALTRRFTQVKNVDLYGGDDAAALRDVALSWAIDRLGAFAGND